VDAGDAAAETDDAEQRASPKDVQGEAMDLAVRKRRAPRLGLPLSLLVALIGCIGAFVLPPYYAGLLTLIGLYALVTIGLNLFMGYAGQVSLGQAAFMALGAYTSAVLAKNFAVTPWLGTIAGALVAAILAFVISFVTRRLREHYLAIATLAFGIVVTVFLAQTDYVGGNSGLRGIPGFTIGAHALDRHAYTVMAWVLVALAVAFSENLVRSAYGRALVALGRGELGAAALGIDGDALKRQIFMLSAVFAGIAGGVYASYYEFIDPTSFNFLVSVNFVLMSVVGGLRSVGGAILGAAVIVALGQALQILMPMVLPNATGDVQTFFYGVILIVILVNLPQGLLSARLRTPRRAA
jgi:branched-chain amino acid transport system permease protein